jgi:hypothetical protein
MGDTESGGKWLTYKQLADLRGIKQRAAVRLSQRRGWRRQPGNDGATRVLVPADMLEVSQRPSQGDDADDDRATWSETMAAIETAHRGEVEALKGQVDALRTLADAAGAKLVDAESRATGATARAERAEGERDRIAGELAQAVERRTAAEVEARRLREAENARQQLGRWRRAWRGWRGR